MRRDRFLAVAYFQRGVHQLALKMPGKAVQDFNYAVDVGVGRRGPPAALFTQTRAVAGVRFLPPTLLGRRQYLRGNALIDYTQLGMPFRLYYCEVLYNRAICGKALNFVEDATEDVALVGPSPAPPERAHAQGLLTVGAPARARGGARDLAGAGSQDGKGPQNHRRSDAGPGASAAASPRSRMGQTVNNRR